MASSEVQSHSGPASIKKRPGKKWDWKILGSVKIAVFVLLTLVASLATATFLESIYDTPTAQYFVYRSFWFHALLSLLAMNIFFSALTRYPWKLRHTPFLMAHVGIMTMLIGSLITERRGLDGSLRISEGEVSSAVELDDSSLVMVDASTVHSVLIPWQPPSTTFKPFNARDRGAPYDVKVDQFLSHADADYSFVPNKSVAGHHFPAVKLRISGGPMKITQDFWMWGGDPQWSQLQMGPSLFILAAQGQYESASELSQLPKGHPVMLLNYNSASHSPGALNYRAISSEGKLVRGSWRTADLVKVDPDHPPVLEPGWKNVKISPLQWIEDAVPMTTYRPARVEYGREAPASAIHVVTGNGGEGSEVWLGLGDRAALHFEGREVEIGYSPNRVILPFSVRLERFSVEHYEGTVDPSSYASKVSILDGPGIHPESGNPVPNRETLKDVMISMNEPLKFAGVTLYQASYEDAQPRPVTSIFSVNRDPGRPWKYTGSLLIVLGTILLFGVKYRNKGLKK